MATDSVFLYNLATALSIVINLVFWAIVVRTGLRLMNISVSSQVADMLNMVTLPILTPFQRFVPKFGGIDWSPLLAGVTLQVIQRTILV